MYVALLWLCVHRLTSIDIDTIPNPPQYECTLLKEPLCGMFHRDPLTIITNAWGTLQLTWTFMLVFVHLTQVGRALTTYETMKGQGQVGPLMAVVTTGSLTAEGAQINASGAGPDPVGHSHPHKKKKETCLTQWSRLLGLDTFYTIAFQGYRKAGKDKDAAARPKQSNPFSRGLFRNCQDFWMDGPIFGRKESCRALLGGEVVNYAEVYEVPRAGMRYRGAYESVPTVEEV